MLIAKKIKLEVSDRDAATLEFMQGKCRGLYNWWVMKLKNGEKWPVWKRTYTCPKCGLVMDRDENSAVNILTRYFARRGPYAPDVEYGVLQDGSLEVASTGLAQDAEVQQLELW